MICKAILGLATISSTYGVVLALTACIPLRAFWDISVKNAYCHGNDIWWVNTALHVITDFMIWTVPLPQVWRTKMPKPQKYTLLSMFSLGFMFVSPFTLPSFIRCFMTAQANAWIAAWR